MGDFQDAMSDGINNIEDNRERRLIALRHRVTHSLDDQRKQDYLGNITRLKLHNNQDSDSDQSAIEPGILENTFDGITDVVRGGAKVALTTGKILYHTTKAVYNFGHYANNLLPGASSSSSSNRNIPEPPSEPIRRRLRVKTPEFSGDEAHRRLTAGEEPDDIVDDFIRRRKFGPRRLRNK